MLRFPLPVVLLASLAACGGDAPPPDAAPDAAAEQAAAPAALPGEGATAYVGATVWDGTGSAARAGMTLVVRDGRVEGLAPEAPAGAEIVDIAGTWIVPGIINAHGHVSGAWAPDDVTDPKERVIRTLGLYARYGITTVLSLGGAPDEAFALRSGQDSPSLARTRILVAGEPAAGDTPEAASAIALRSIARGADWIKLRVDDNLGTTAKMPWPAVQVVMNAAKAADKPVATHIFYMDDAARLLDMGTGLIAHSVRDRPMTDEFVQKLAASGVCYVPTLVREVSAFIYASRPEWFDDPFFLEAASRSEIERLSDPAGMAAVASSAAAAGYRKALEQAKENLRIAIGSGIPVAFGTDSGPAGRFPGYFEHLEFDLMTDAGLTPREILLSATSVAARCIGLDDAGSLEAGKWADFIVLEESPVDDIRAMRSIRDVYIAGNRVAR